MGNETTSYPQTIWKPDATTVPVVGKKQHSTLKPSPVPRVQEHRLYFDRLVFIKQTITLILCDICLLKTYVAY